MKYYVITWILIGVSACLKIAERFIDFPGVDLISDILLYSSLIPLHKIMSVYKQKAENNDKKTD